ncbi:unnamed protein product [Cuscuta europaea]|uniref:Uncharacterized protein n=1 Tax=Cuscuta europaea TaxID=41803 RepID=A0A9P0YQH3_CUSEU|nr:unnamed protein product [Cuscuta europaea]
MDIAAILRSKYNVKKETDMVALIEEAVLVASLVVPERLKKHRSRIVKLLFDDNPARSDLLFSDDELFDDDEDKNGRLGSKITHDSPLPPVKSAVAGDDSSRNIRNNKTNIKIPTKGGAVSPPPGCGGGSDVHGGGGSDVHGVGCKRKSLKCSKVVQAPTCGVKQRLLSKIKRRKVQYNTTWIR